MLIGLPLTDSLGGLQTWQLCWPDLLPAYLYLLPITRATYDGGQCCHNVVLFGGEGDSSVLRHRSDVACLLLSRLLPGARNNTASSSSL
jgi:hypothetical protein